MSALHTPGPWNYREYFNSLKDEIGVSGRALCTVWVRRAPSRADGAQATVADADPEGEANARLISAAPDLLAACNAYLADRAEAGCTADSAAVKAMRTAVAKAEAA